MQPHPTFNNKDVTIKLMKKLKSKRGLKEKKWKEKGLLEDTLSQQKIKFKPKLHYSELIYYLESTIGRLEIDLPNSEIYKLVKKITALAWPSYEDEFDKRWCGFYLPLKRAGRLICIPIEIVEYKGEYFVYFGSELKIIHVRKGDKKCEGVFETIFSEILRFVPILKKNSKILEKLVPYDIRTGKIKGKYVLEETMSEEEKERILKKYKKHMEKRLEVKEISLNEYLNVASICYKAAYGEKVGEISPIEMYKRFADGRHGGMLEIKDWNNRKQFMKWLESGRWGGCHPFEIVYSWKDHGIHLYPPTKETPYFRLRVTDYMYAESFIKMVGALIENEIPFQALHLEEVLNYLAGETHFRVNEYSKHTFFYIPSKEYKKLYFKHIEWDKLETPKWK